MEVTVEQLGERRRELEGAADSCLEAWTLWNSKINSISEQALTIWKLPLDKVEVTLPLIQIVPNKFGIWTAKG